MDEGRAERGVCTPSGPLIYVVNVGNPHASFCTHCTSLFRRKLRDRHSDQNGTEPGRRGSKQHQQLLEIPRFGLTTQSPRFEAHCALGLVVTH